MTRLIFAFIVAVLVSGPALAADGLALIDLRKAAGRGEIEAQTDLGSHYLLGKGVPRDPEIARGWFAKAADRGHPLAQTILGWLYMGGAGIEADHVKAASWLEKAAYQGVPEAQLSLGTLYALGEGVPQKLTDAYVWLTLAADRLQDRDKMLEAQGWRRSVAQHMSREQIEESRGLAQQMSIIFAKP